MNQNKQFQFLLYRAETEDISVNALAKDETFPRIFVFFSEQTHKKDELSG